MTQRRRHRITGEVLNSVEDLAFAVPINCIEQVSRDYDCFSDLLELEQSIDRFITKLIVPSESPPESGAFVGQVSLLRNNLPEYRERLIRKGVEYTEAKWEEGKLWYANKDDFFAATAYASAAHILEIKTHCLGHLVSKMREEGFNYVWLNWKKLASAGKPIHIPGSEDSFICPTCKTIGDLKTLEACKHIVACPSCAFLHPKGAECISLEKHQRSLREKFLADRAANPPDPDWNQWYNKKE